MATAFWVEGLKSVTCKEEQRDKKYQNKCGGARSRLNTKTNQGFVSDVPTQCGIVVRGKRDSKLQAKSIEYQFIKCKAIKVPRVFI